MEIIKLTLGQMQSNTYILKKDNHVIIIDPGAEADKIIKHISEDDIVSGVLLTHGHFDHIGALNDVWKAYSCDVYASIHEKTLLLDPNLSYYIDPIECSIQYFNSNLSIDDFEIIVHHTPGHTRGSVMFEIDNNLFTGDTIFDMGIGRMDFPTGDQFAMRDSLKYIKSFTKDYIIHPGHGDTSTLFKQFTHNPYFK